MLNSPEYQEKKKLINEYFTEDEKNKENIKYESIRNYIEEYFIFPKDDLVNNLVDVLNKTVYFKEDFKLLFDDYYRQYYIEILGETNYDCFKLIKLSLVQFLQCLLEYLKYTSSPLYKFLTIKCF